MRRSFIAATLLLAVSSIAFAQADEPSDPPPPRCELGSCYDPLFTIQYPYTHSFVTSTNVRFRLPARYYDGSAALIVGSGNLAQMQEWTEGTGYQPVRTETGSGIGGLVVGRYTDTDLAPYSEAITLFPVSTEPIVVADDPGVMVATLLDPEIRLWVKGLILDEELPIVAGREYVFMPKEPEPKTMSVMIGAQGTVNFDFAEPDGTPIANGTLRPDPESVVRPALGLARSEGTRRFATTVVARGGNFLLRFVFRNIERPDAIARLAGVGHVADPSGAAIAECCTRDGIWLNPTTTYGADLAALELEPRAILTLTGLRFVLDIDL